MTSNDANRVAVATTSQLAADAAAEIAELGGNAVDCALAAALCSINTQPGVCALAGSAYVTVWEAGRKPVTIDGNAAIPGIGLGHSNSPTAISVRLDYGGGVETLIGPQSVAVPGTPAALFMAAKRFGGIAWSDLLQPSIRAARDGFPLAAACHHYLQYAGSAIFARSSDGFRALHRNDGSLRDEGSRIVVPDLAATLQYLADDGPAAFYSGEIGQRIVAHVQDGGGMLTAEDLKQYKADCRYSLTVNAGDWEIATNPPPAIGGANLAAMLLSFGTDKLSKWSEDLCSRLVQTQAAVMAYRMANLDNAIAVEEAVASFLDDVHADDFMDRWTSGSTVHTSAVDGNHLACSVTASSGYGSGEMPANTGLWLNNCLGELELNRQGLDAGPPGRHLPSNMAPSTARSTNAVLAIGSPGADRITTAIHQVIVNFAQMGLDLDEAVAHPRMHLKISGTDRNLAIEPGLDSPDVGIDVTRYPSKSMYFGGVVAALADDDNRFHAAADPRREGGTYVN